MATHGSVGYFAVEDSGASQLRNISPYLTAINPSRSNDTHDVTCFGATGHAFAVGLMNGTIGLAGFWDKTASVGSATVLDSLLGLKGSTVGFEWGPEGNSNGNVKYSGEAVLVNFDVSEPVADMVSFSATLQISGAVAKGTFSS
jgi:hypothetical protein